MRSVLVLWHLLLWLLNVQPLPIDYSAKDRQRLLNVFSHHYWEWSKYQLGNHYTHLCIAPSQTHVGVNYVPWMFTLTFDSLLSRLRCIANLRLLFHRFIF